MKIAFDYQIFSLQGYGGISRYYARLAEEMVTTGEDVFVFAGFHRNNYLSSLPHGVVKGSKLKRYPKNTGRIFRTANHYLTNRQIASWQPDIVHETYYSSRRPPKLNAPRIVTVYDMIHELFPDQFGKDDKTTFRKKCSFERAVHIISISHSTRQDLVNLFGIEPSKISVVHLASDILPAAKGYSDSDDKLYKPFLLYVGLRGGYKNFSSFLRSISSSERLKKDFNVIAFGGGDFSPSELSFIKTLGFKNEQVRQIGGGDEVLTGLYKTASAFVFPSLYEGFGLPPLEAMACHCPVISSNTSSMPEVIGDAGEYFDPKNIENMTGAIENVVYSPSRSQELKNRGLKRTREYSWQKCASETMDIYKKIAG